MVKKIFELVMEELAKLEEEQAVGIRAADCQVDHTAASSVTQASLHAGQGASIEISKKVLSESDVKLAHRSGAREILVSRKAIVTCLAAEYAQKQSITITRKP